MPLKRLVPNLIPLNDFNSPVQTGLYEPITLLELPSGLVQGDYFDLTEQEANNLSDAAVGTLHAGRYRLVQIEAGATQANIAVGRIGLMRTTALGLNVVTSYDRGLGPGMHPVIFLNAGTPGNYVFVQELGIATVQLKTPLTNVGPAIGDIINSVATGLADDPTSQNYVSATLGVSLQLPVANTKILVQLETPVLQG